MDLKKSGARANWAQVGYMALSFALSYIAGRLLAKKSGLKIDDDKPTTLTTRGSYCNFVIGRRRVGPVFACAPLADREIKKEKAAGGKGAGTSQKTDVYYEVGWHVLCSNGPVWALHQIIQSGMVIFEGPITSDSHPSGSTIDLGKEGSFTIYWGEEDQPINTFLGDVDRVGITSRWPFFCYIVWNKKRLGTSPQWQALDYVIERRLEGTLLTDSTGYYEPTIALTGDTATIFSHTNGVEGSGRFTFAGDKTQEFRNGQSVELLGNTMANGTYDVLRAETVQVVIGANPITGLPVYTTRTNVYLYGGVAGANDSGTLQQYNELPDDGLNPAHIVADILFNEWPQGLTLDPDGDEPWDMDSLEEFGVDSEDDEIRASYIGVNGEKASAALGAFLQDYGVLLPIDTRTGKMKFQLVREPSGTVSNLAAGAVVGSLPEIETNHAEVPVDKLIFKFTDREHYFGDMTIGIDNDGQASYQENQRSRTVDIPTVINFGPAATISERRSQEELAGAGVISIDGARGARKLLPGQPLIVEGIDDILRITGVEFDPLSSLVKIKAMIDFYGAKKSEFVNSPGGGTITSTPVEPDEQFDLIEVPEYLLSTSDMTLVIPRIRAHDQILSADLWISRDNSTYTLINTELNVQTGGTLNVALAVDSYEYVALGPTFDSLGPDIATALDLSADTTNWGLGRQLCVIVSDSGTEICFAQSLTAMGGGSYRINGLLRARYDTVQLAHAVGARVYIFENTAIEESNDVLLVPGEDLYGKTQPNSSAGQLALSSVSPVAIVLHGKGVKPMDCGALHVTAPSLGSPSYRTGNNASFKWGYRSTVLSKTGYGLQASGAVTGVSPVEGTFTIKFLTSGGVLKRAVSQSTNTYTYTNANLVADFGAEPASYKVQVTLTNGGYTSDPVEITVTKVT